MEFIRPFERIGKSDAAIGGGKGASLGEMTQAGIPVPPGFVVLASAFEKFLEEEDLNQELDAIFHTVDHREIRTVDLASEKIRKLIVEAKMSAEIAQEIRKNFKKLGAEFVAVRSSATAEDSTSAAWAGQLETYLNTTGADLIENVQRCWASLFTPRAIFYRFEKGMHGQKISVAVVVQKMIQSEVSGIAFSVHPVTEDYNQLIIEAGFGLGEAIVSGQVTPDSYVVEKVPRRIIDKNITYQNRALWRAANGGNEWRDLSEEEGSKPALTDEQTLELAEIVLRIEKHYSFPCDIEWAYEAGQFYITQSRPITTLGVSKPKPNGGVGQESFFLHYTQSEIGVLIMDLIQDKSAYGELDYVILIENDIVRAYLTERGLNEAYELGTRLFDGGFFESLVSEAAEITTDIERYGAPRNFSLEEWDALVALWVRMWSPYRFCDEPMQRVLEEALMRELKADEITTQMTLDRYPTSLSEQAKHVFEVLKTLGRIKLDLHLKAERLITEGLDKFSHFFERKYELTKSEFYALRTSEVRDTIAGNKVPLAEARERLKGCVFYREASLWRCARGDVFLEWKRRIERTESAEVKGRTAYRGVAKGCVVKHLSWTGTKEIPPGSILVTGMTNPQMTPYLKNASAIVTDEGGLTCHAVIISRELKIPCVVGTKTATKILKDGDMVEVDADRGIVRKI